MLGGRGRGLLEQFAGLRGDSSKKEEVLFLKDEVNPNYITQPPHNYLAFTSPGRLNAKITYFATPNEIKIVC